MPPVAAVSNSSKERPSSSAAASGANLRQSHAKPPPRRVKLFSRGRQLRESPVRQDHVPRTIAQRVLLLLMLPAAGGTGRARLGQKQAVGDAADGADDLVEVSDAGAGEGALPVGPEEHAAMHPRDVDRVSLREGREPAAFTAPCDGEGPAEIWPARLRLFCEERLSSAARSGKEQEKNARKMLRRT